MECLSIAKAWVYQSSRGPSQREDSLWESIATHCRNEYKVTRGSEVIQSTWKRVSRSCQNYLAARESVIKNLLSGRTMEESGDQAMELYCSRADNRDRYGKF